MKNAPDLTLFSGALQIEQHFDSSLRENRSFTKMSVRRVVNDTDGEHVQISIELGKVDSAGRIRSVHGSLNLPAEIADVLVIACKKVHPKRTASQYAKHERLPMDERQRIEAAFYGCEPIPGMSRALRPKAGADQ